MWTIVSFPEIHCGDSDPGSVFHFHDVVLRSLAVVSSQSDRSFGQFLGVRLFLQKAQSNQKQTLVNKMLWRAAMRVQAYLRL